MPDLPSGTVTFLFTDIAGSTELTRQLGERWGGVLAEQRRLLREAVAADRGQEVDAQGDAFFFVFNRARDAVLAATKAQRTLTRREWPDGVGLRVRMGIHTGEPTVDEEGYLGLDVVRAARICSAAHGGQVLVSESVRVLVRDPPAGIEFGGAGTHRLKGLDETEPLFQLVAEGLEREFPSLREDAAEPMIVPEFDAKSFSERLERQLQEFLAESLRGVPTQPEAEQPQSRPGLLERVRRRGTR